MNQRVTIVIPSYNGLYLLNKHLPSVIANSPKGTRILVAEDGGTDIRQDLKKSFPSVDYFYSPKNLGFPRIVNHAVSAVATPYFVLLNNDVEPKPSFLIPALDRFSDPSVFAVTFNETSSSWPDVRFSGKLQFTQGADKTRPRYSAWASGGSAVFRKDFWDQLGGFNPAYSPGYWEDIDIGYRAWKQGLKIIWEPKAQVEHQHESTFARLNPAFISLVKQRNELLFNWQNLTDSDLGKEHCRWLFKYALAHPGYIRVILAAIGRCSAFRPSPQVRTDAEVLKLVNQPL